MRKKNEQRTVNEKQEKRGAWVRSGLAALCLAAVLPACSTTQQVEVQKTDIKCGFLGVTCDRLVAGNLSQGQTDLRYINPNANWTQYKKVLIDPVTFWGDDNTRVSPADQQILVNFFQQALRDELSKKFEVVDQAGPGVVRVQIAIMDVSAATPGLRTISLVIPQARTLNTLKYAATGSYAFVGGAQVEGKLTDAVTGQVLAEAVDKRIGGGSLEAAAQWQWGDAENAMTAWATMITNRLSTWTSGAVKPS